MLDKFFPLYITVFIIAFTLTVLVERRLLPILKSCAKQPIYADGPRWHLSKSGTPTMGGLAFVISISIALIVPSLVLLLIGQSTEALSLVICQLYATSNAMIGIYDDLKKLRRQENRGLSVRGKLFLQIICASAFLFVRSLFFDDVTVLSFSFGNIDIGGWYYPLSLFILVGLVNCANLTDGIDGLASSVAFSIGISLTYIAIALSVEVATLATCIVGGTIAFLIFNLHPAKIFMGDTGSLYFGALIGAAGIMLGNPLLIIPIAGVYVLEGVSVITQVVFFKLTRKRIFKMAPLHHHMERCGWSENRICIVAMLLTFLFSLPIYVFYLP